jgi:excisionase family DNA binding protein
MVMTGKPSLMTVDELAKYLRMKKVTIYKHAQARKLPGFKVGSSWRFKKSTIDKWIADKENSRT